MADTVATNTILNGAASGGSKRAIVHLTCISDATGETNVVKVDRSAMILPGTLAAPSKLHIASVRWNVQGFSYIKLMWHAYTDGTHTSDDPIAILSGNGYDNFEQHGGLRFPNTVGTAISGSIGDVILSSVGATSGATYDITLEVILA